MKIKTITCHDVYNYGASLQAYALMKYLENLGHEVEIIDYKPDYLNRRYNLWRIGYKWNQKGLIVRIIYFLFKIPLRLITWKGKFKFDIFKRKYMRITPLSYKSNENLRKNPPEANTYIAGSDQIWNTSYENGRDPAFYLDFAPPGTRRVSYAASFSVSKILPEYKSFVQSMIKKFDFISVREREGLGILESIGINNGKHVLDPVFLLEKKMWDELINKRIEDKYILVYDFENNPKIERFVKEFANKNRLKIFAVNNYKKTPYANKDFFSSGPRTFLSLIKNAEYIVSNSFHGMAFSLIYEKEFFVFNREKQEVNSRMRDLLQICNLSNRLLIPQLLPQKAINKSFSKINYNKVNQKLKEHILLSKSFLDNSLS